LIQEREVTYVRKQRRGIEGDVEREGEREQIVIVVWMT